MLALLSACNSGSKAPEAPASGGTGAPGGITQVPGGNASTAATDTDAAKRSALWLDDLVEPRQPGRFAPRDECGKLPGARAFREKLAAAVQARDVEAITAMATPDIRLGFGGEDGRRRFHDALTASDDKLMKELGKLLQLGCAGSEGGGLTIPWYFQQEMGDIDSYSGMLVTGMDVPLREKADAAAKLLKTVSWDVVTLTSRLAPDARFQQVHIGGVTGFIATDKLRSLLAYRLLAVRQGDDWKITALVAGD